MTAVVEQVERREVHRVKLSDITIKEGRQRTEMGDLEGLALSILTHGLLNPVILNRNNELIAGERRIHAHKMNGAVYIDALYRDELDPIDLEELELEENIRRKQLTWQEEQKAIARIHKLKQMKDPNWSMQQTATVIMKPGAEPQKRDVSDAVTLDRMMKLFPEIAGAKSKAQAINMARAKAKNVNRRLDVQQDPVTYLEVQEKIWLGDSVKLIKDIEANLIDCIITDPPFGINYDAHVAGTVGEENVYKDDAEKYEYILTMVPDLYRVLKPDGWCIWFFGMTWYERVKTVFRQAGFSVDEIPIVWNRSEGRCYTNRPDHYFTKAYDVALHCFKGDPHIIQKNRPNLISIPPVESKERELVVERPVELYAELIRRLTIEGQLVADFFVGSGSCPAAAASLKRDYLGVELDENRRAAAIQKIRANIPS
jgi:DNA modification methylase